VQIVRDAVAAAAIYGLLPIAELWFGPLTLCVFKTADGQLVLAEAFPGEQHEVDGPRTTEWNAMFVEADVVLLFGMSEHVMVRVDGERVPADAPAQVREVLRAPMDSQSPAEREMLLRQVLADSLAT